MVHRKDKIEPVEIGNADLPAAQTRNVDAMRARHRDRARIGRIAAMPAPCARRIDRPAKIELTHPVPERTIGERRAADIAEAHEQDRWCLQRLAPSRS